MKFGEPYKTGKLATTELHAGGVLFYVVYRQCLQFAEDGQVKLWNEIIDEGLPLDDELTELKNEKHAVKYELNRHKYIEFEVNESEYTCKLSEEDSNNLVCFIWDKSNNAARVSDSVVFSI